MTKNSRVKDARIKAGLTQSELAYKIEAKQPYIAKLEKNEDFSILQATKLAEILGVTADWLMNGSESEKNNSQVINNNPSINNDNKGVPYYDIDFVGGFDLVFNNNQVNPAFYIDFLPFNDADYWVNVSGKSMGPLIAHGDIVALKKVEDWQTFLLEGEIYAVITNNGFRTIKMIGQGNDKDHYTLIPYNKSGDYKPQQIPKTVITHIFRVKGAIKKFF